MDKMTYEKPVLSDHGSVASLTKGKPGSDVGGRGWPFDGGRNDRGRGRGRR
jgi:hypothetical protein